MYGQSFYFVSQERYMAPSPVLRLDILRASNTKHISDGDALEKEGPAIKKK